MSNGSLIIVGMSGGVDSSVTAWLLQRQGYRVEGLFMKNWEDDDTDTRCSAEADHADARRVADQLGIPLHRANFARHYRARVFEHCLEEFRAGRTPNPDILCNQHIKFRAFLDHARRLGADRVATGHYAGVSGPPGQRRLLRARDAAKDQTYFLYALDQEQLEAAMFPLADFTKAEVRGMADQAGFGNHDKPDSTGICFIGERDFREFLGRYIAATPGAVVSVDGELVGQHTGLAFYTIGQRRGLALGGRADRPGLPWYVVDKHMDNNRLVVAQGHNHPALMSRGLVAGDWHWIDGEGPARSIRCTLRLRHRQTEQPATLHPLPDGRWRLDFDEPQRAVTPGQSVVVYDQTGCLGGGVIDERLAVQETSRAGVA